MGTLYIEGLASHDGPESCAGAREGAGEAWTGVHAGGLLSREMLLVRGADAVLLSGRQHCWQRYRELPVDPARSENTSMRGASMCEIREILWPPVRVIVGAGRSGKAEVVRPR